MSTPAGIRSVIFEECSRRPLPAQVRHGLSITRPAPSAVRAGLGDAEDAAGTDDLAATAAGGAGLGGGPLFGAAPVARLARVQLGERDFLLATLGGLQEGDLHVVAQVVARAARRRRRVCRRRRGPRRCSRRRRPPGRCRRGRGSRRPRARARDQKAAWPKLVVIGAGLGIVEDFVGLAQFLEFLLGRLVVGVAVRMMLEGELAVGLLDFLRCRRSGPRPGLRNNRAWPWRSGGGLLGHNDPGGAHEAVAESIAFAKLLDDAGLRARRRFPAGRRLRAGRDRTFARWRQFPPARLRPGWI